MEQPKGKLTIVVEDDGMDSGCISDILQACINHGKVIAVSVQGTVAQEYTMNGHTYKVGETYEQDLLHYLKQLTPEEGKC